MIFPIMDNNNHVIAINDQEQTVKHSDFSIDHILNRAGGNVARNSETQFYCDRIVSENVGQFEWLQCSRYCPPKIPRMHKKDVQKRQLGRHPRIPFTSHQLSILERKFRESPYLSSEEVTVLSKKLQLADIRVKIWFQNRRARERREKNEISGEYKSAENKKVSEKTCSSTEYLNFCSRGVDNDHNRVKVAEVNTGPLDCSKTSTLIISNVASDIFKCSEVSVPYVLPNSVLSQNVPLFIPFVNFNSPNQDLKS